MKRFRKRDRKFVLLLGATTLLIVVFFLAGVEVAKVVTGGARKVDAEKIESLIREGELSSREAMYGRTREAEQAPPGSNEGE